MPTTERRLRQEAARNDPNYVSHNEARKLAFIADYEHFAGYGMSHAEIAERMGMRLDTINTRMRRYGMEPVLSFGERMVQRRLEQLIASGKPFSANSLPSLDTSDAIIAAINRAQNRGRIKKIGQTTGKKHLNIYVGVPASNTQTA